MSEYWWGVLTLPLLTLTLFAGFVAWVHVVQALQRRGVTFELKWERGVEGISNYVLQHDIWWERSRGPVFVGGWYREGPNESELFTRWIGIGQVDGPCWMVLLKRDLGGRVVHE